jgi:hypothetical protein
MGGLGLGQLRLALGRLLVQLLELLAPLSLIFFAGSKPDLRPLGLTR